jgi:hypothetical protein
MKCAHPPCTCDSRTGSRLCCPDYEQHGTRNLTALRLRAPRVRRATLGRPGAAAGRDRSGSAPRAVGVPAGEPRNGGEGQVFGFEVLVCDRRGGGGGSSAR